LKQAPASPVSQVEPDRVARQKPPHDGRNGSQAGTQKQMEMMGHQGPGKADRLTLAKNAPKSVKKIVAVGRVPENRNTARFRSR
jgi:hypothetical protein